MAVEVEVTNIENLLLLIFLLFKTKSFIRNRKNRDKHAHCTYIYTNIEVYE